MCVATSELNEVTEGHTNSWYYVAHVGTWHGELFGHRCLEH